MKKIPVVAVVGPTASGKTALAVAIAKRFNGEVVSADSMQIYKGMDIATAKPTKEDMQGIAHHLIDYVEPNEKYSVARYTEDAKKAIQDVYGRQKLPVVCGGTGLYIDSLLGNIRFEEEPDNTAVRQALTERMQKEGAQVLLDELSAVDPEAAAQLHVNNTGRIIRALEIYQLTGETATQRRIRSREQPSPYEVLYLAIGFPDRDFLYERIDLRVELMLKMGLEAEASAFLARSDADTAAQTIGYKELKGWFAGVLSREEAIENLKRETRRYAKRQMTWFRRNQAIHYIDRTRDTTQAQLEDKAFAWVEHSGILKGV